MFNWTPPLRLDSGGVEYISARQTNGFYKLLNMNIMTSGAVSIISVVEHDNENLPAFRIENRTPDFRLRFRQTDTDKMEFVRRTLKSGEFCYYGWDDPNLSKTLDIAVVDCNDTESAVRNKFAVQINKLLEYLDIYL